MNRITVSAWAGCLLFGFGSAAFAAPRTLSLHEGWSLQASAKVKEKGEALSDPAYVPKDWHAAAVPTTVLAALVDDSVYKDIYFGKNLQKIPEDQFKTSWWFRRAFDLADTTSYADARLVFEGINYRANIYLNGRKIASADTCAGAFRIFTLDVTGGLRRGKNALAVEVFPPQPGDYTMGFVDWNPMPPDHEMGLFRPVSLQLTGPVSVEYPYVVSQVDAKTLSARVSVSALVSNRTGSEVTGTLRGKIGSAAFKQEYALKPHEARELIFSPDKYPQLALAHPKLWWPAELGKPELTDLHVSAETKAGVSDSQSARVGIRQVEDYMNEKGYRGYKVNGRKLLIRGGGWQDELLLREDAKNMDAQMRYVLHMGLNTVRLEGIWGSSHKLYDLADQYGILLMVGWSCQWEWNDNLGKTIEDTTDTLHSGPQSPADINLILAYFHDQVHWLRSHPSLFVWSIGSDKLAWPESETRHRKDIAVLDPGLALLGSCRSWKSAVSGETGVKMLGPYDYVTPNYWYEDTGRGGAFGFNTETGPGAEPVVYESLKRMLPADSLWPINDMWFFHCGLREFRQLDNYLAAFNHHYGPARDADDFSFKAQAANYEAMRPMFESFGVNRSVTTGIIQWMLNASWPKMYWQLYDYYLLPTGAFYGARKGNQPLSLAYNYGNRSISLINRTRLPQSGLQAVVTVFDAASKPVFTKTLKADLGPDSAAKILDLPPPQGITPLYFLAMALRDSTGREISDNFYWLSLKKDVPDWDKADWEGTPTKEFSDFTALNQLPSAALIAKPRFSGRGKNQEITVTLKNPSKAIAFFIELSVKGDRGGRTVAPVFWDDNYVSLAPGQSKTLHATFATEDLGGEKPVFSYRGWNVKAAGATR